MDSGALGRLSAARIHRVQKVQKVQRGEVSPAAMSFICRWRGPLPPLKRSPSPIDGGGKCVPGFALVSPLLHDEELKPPSTGRGAPKATEDSRLFAEKPRP